MLKEQDELLRLSIRQRPNQQRIGETQHCGCRADGKCNRHDRD
jgi:hypothetical protein